MLLLPAPGQSSSSFRVGGARFSSRCEHSQVVVEADEGSPQAGAQLEFDSVLTGVKSERPKNFYPKKGQDLEMVCESLAYKGLGLCKVVDTGFVVFCERALPGERLVARIIKKRKGFAEVGGLGFHSALMLQSAALMLLSVIIWENCTSCSVRIIAKPELFECRWWWWLCSCLKFTRLN